MEGYVFNFHYVILPTPVLLPRMQFQNKNGTG